MALFKKKKDEEESGAPSSRIIDAVKNLYSKAVESQKQAVQADQAVAREQARQITQPVQKIYSAYDQGTQAAAKANMATAQAQNQKVQNAARQIYSAYQQQQETAARDQMAQQTRQLQERQAQQSQRMQDAERNLYQQAQRQQEQLQFQRQQMQDQAKALSGIYNTARISVPQQLIDAPFAGVTSRMDQRSGSLSGADPNKGVGAYADILNREDYSEKSKAGESKLSWMPWQTDIRYDYINDINGARQQQDMQTVAGENGAGYAKYSLMNDDEIGVYNYLYATQGREAADAFLDKLEPELNAQWYSGVSRYATEQASENPLAYSVATVAAQPLRTMTSLMATGEDVARTLQGKEIDPYSDLRQASQMTRDIRSRIAEDVQQSPGILGTVITDNARQLAEAARAEWAARNPNGESNPFANAGPGDEASTGEAAAFLYQSMMSAMDSAVNAGVAKGAASLTGLEGETLMQMTNEIASLAMSSEVMSTSVADSKLKGYSNEGALSLGLVRAAIEYASEKLGGEWVIRNIQANPLNLVSTMLMNMIPEGVEEVMSDAANGAVNLIIDNLFGTQESGIPQLVEYYSGEDWKKEQPVMASVLRFFGQENNPMLATVLAILGEEGLSFLGGALATFGSSGAQYSTNIASINATAQQLNTTQENVVKLMEQYDTDNAGAIQFMAAAVDAHSVDEFTDKMKQYKTAQDAVDEILKKQGQQENKNAPTERGAVEVDLEGVFDNGEQSADRGQQNGYDALSTGGEDLRNETGTQRGGVDAGYESSQGRDRFQNYGVKEIVTPAALGVTNGSSTQNIEVLDESTFLPGSPEARAAQTARESGLEPVFIRGTMDVGGKQARAYIKGGRVILQADGRVDADNLLKHEQYHDAAQMNPQLRQIMREALADNMTQEELGALVSRYIQAYDGVYDFSQMTQEQIEEICEEELFADLYAGIDNTGRQDLRDAAQQGYTQAGNNNRVQESENQTTEKAALNPEFEQEFDNWLANGSEEYRLRDRGRFLVGITSDKLKSAGVDDYEIYFGKSKIARIMKEHKEMTPAKIKDAVKLIEDPIIVIDSTTVPGSIVMFGDAKTDSGKPIMVSMILHPETKTGEILDYGVVSSAYGRRVNNAQNLINTSNVRYVESDKKRIGSWSKELGLQLPSSSTTDDSDSIITDNAEKSNSENEGRGSVEVPTKTAEEYDADRQRALDYFGTTYNTNEAGYITTDGRYLDFSGRHDGAPGGYRTVDHRDVSDAFDGDYGDGSYSGAMVEFMRGGNIRVSPENGGINLMGKPTKRQTEKLQQYIQKYRGEVILDIDDRNGNTLFSLEYPRMTNSRTILQDITDYFDRGIKPQVYDNGRFSVETPGDLRQQLAQAEREYMDHSNANDTEYDYRAQMEKIDELRRQIQEADTAQPTEQNETIESLRQEGRVSNPTYDVNTYGDPHPERGEMGSDGVRICKDTDALEAELTDFYAGKIRNDTGEYFARIRSKKEGGYLLTVNRDGKRDISRTFGNPGEAAAFAASYIDGQTQARTDAELDQEKSAPVPKQTAAEAAMTGTVQDEAARQKKNKAAELGTQALRDRIRKTDEEIKALRRLEKTTGLSDLQKEHMADLRESLETMNDELTSRKGRAREKKEKVEVKGNKPVRSAAEARKRLMDIFSTATGAREETGQKIDAALAKFQNDGKITERDRQELIDTLIDAGAVRQEAAEELRDIRDRLRGARIFVNDQERADFGDDWNTLRKRAWGAGIYLTNNPTDQKIDSLVGEMADSYGANMFPTDEALSDMLANLIEKADAGKSQLIPFAEAVKNEAGREGIDPQEIWDDLSRQVDETLRSFGEKADLEVDLKNRTASMLATERKRAEDRLDRMAQRRRESEIREKTMKAIKRLAKLKGKAAPDVRADIDEALKDIDTHARQLTISGLEDLQELERVYEEAKKAAGYEGPENPGNFISNPYIEERLSSLTKKHINDMDIDDVIELGRVVAALENTVKTQNKMIGDEFDQTIRQTADEVDAEVKKAKGIKPGMKQELHKWFREEMLSPRRFLNMLGGWKNGAMAKLGESLENGQTRMLDFQRRAMQSMDPFMDNKQNKKWFDNARSKDAKWTTYTVANGLATDGSGITGQTIEISPLMKVSLYLASLNEDNLRHIQTGGLVIPDKDLYIKGNIKEAYDRGQTVKMQPEAVRAIASTLTQEEKTFAGYLQKFFNNQSKDAINEVSMQLDGFERAGVDNYFPIESSKNFLKSDVAGQARSQTVEGIGSIANDRVHAGNPIILSDAYDTFTRQVDNVSRYYGYAIPIRNFQAVNNFVFHEEGNAFAGSVKDTINHKWGSGAEEYITKMLADIQSSAGAKSDRLSGFASKLRGNLAGANLTLNPSVAVSQLASYPGAAQSVGWDGLAAGLVSGPVDEKLIEKYTPLLWYRSQGYSTQEIGDAASAAKKNLAQKALTSKALNWIQGMDRLAVKRLWAAAEYRVQKDTGMKPGSKKLVDSGMDPYYRKVAEVFNRAVYDTQPNYTDMERAQILRSDSDLTKFLTMYKTVPLQYYNMMTEAAGRLQAAKESGNQAEIKAARKYALNTYGGLLAANSVYVAIKAAFKGLRKKDDEYRDEEGNLTTASVLKQLGLDLAETYAGSVIGGAEAYSMIESMATGNKWYGPEISVLSGAEDVYNGINNIFSAIGDDDPQKTAKAIKSAATDMSALYGLPLRNAETYIMAVVRRIFPQAAMEYDNIFGGINKGDLKGMDTDAVGIGANLIMRNRTGADLERAATDELARLYSEGNASAIPTAIPDSFTYGGNEVKIKDKKAYRETWGATVGDNIEELIGSKSYQDADDKTKAAMISKLYQYATVQAREQADPEYSAEGNSTYGWTIKADEAMDSGLDLPTTIAAMTTINGMTSDKENGQTIKSKKTKVVEYIDSLAIDNEQKDALYEMAGYSSGLENAPWHSGISATAGYTSGTNKPKIDEASRKEAVDKYYDQLTGSAAYKEADDLTKKEMIEKLQQYAEVQGMKATDPRYIPTGTAAWTTWAETAGKAGIDLIDAIGYATQLDSFKADYNEYGKAISGSKKDKVVEFIESIPGLTNDQKDVLYLKVYAENSLKYTPWHGYTGKKKKSRRRGGRRRSRKATAKATSVKQVGQLAKGYDTSIDVSTLFGGTSGSKAKAGDASAEDELLDLVNKYGDNFLAAAMAAGQRNKGRTKVDFKI